MKALYASKRTLIGLCLVVALAAALGLSGARSTLARLMAPGPGASRPNIVLIISDDQRFDTMEYMPRTREHIFDRGVTFARAYVTTPLCCPSRASILTGMYAHKHGVPSNSRPLLKTTFAERLHQHGYYTGLIGKYLNSYDGGPPRAEYDYWIGSPRQTESVYTDPNLNVGGEWRAHTGYGPYILRDYALEFLRRADEQPDPFLLVFTAYNPHAPYTAAPGDETLYDDLPPHRPPNFDEADTSDKPEWLRGYPPLTAKQIAKADQVRKRQLQSLSALDRIVESLVTAMERQGQLDNTVIFYISDNGLFLGEHRIPDGRKKFVYEEASRVPFAIRYPAVVQEARIESRLVANIDIAPTIYDLAGIPIPPEVDGRSLIPLLAGTGTWREELLIEGWEKALLPGEWNQTPMAYKAVHTGRYVYVEDPNYRSELYDLQSDPYQLQNRAGDPAFAEVEADLKGRLQRLLPAGQQLAEPDYTRDQDNE